MYSIITTKLSLDCFNKSIEAGPRVKYLSIDWLFLLALSIIPYNISDNSGIRYIMTK